MKAIKIITHPLLLISSFCLIIISGEHWGGFYLLYLLMALPHFGIHALLGVAGIIFLLFSLHNFERRYKEILTGICKMSGVACLIFSVVFFFCADKKGYNTGTFEQVIPLISVIIFAVLALIFIVDYMAGVFSSTYSLRKA